MPKYYEEKEEDGRACGGVREDLRQCLLESACVLQVSAVALPAESPQPRVSAAVCAAPRLNPKGSEGEVRAALPWHPRERSVGRRPRPGGNEPAGETPLFRPF